MSLKQRTITKPVRLTGIGLHSGLTTTLTFKPGSQGIRFNRIDLPHQPSVAVKPEHLVMDPIVSRCTVIEENGARVSTIEHVMAVLNALGIDNIDIDINGVEVPGMDGSSKAFVDALLNAGVVELDKPKHVFAITKPIVVEHNGATVMVVPGCEFTVNYHLDYDQPLMRDQRFGLIVNQESFINNVASARTFCLASEAEAIRQRGLGKGATDQNTLIMDVAGPVNNTLRFPDECCRHKALDIVGDLYTLGFSIKGTVYGVKSGHALNRALVQKIKQQWVNHMTSANGTGRIFDMDAIRKILPHRYPFLFVDRVIEIERRVKGIGIKNVTANDGFFQGHFPQKPVMPGVIMIEAMAQTAGVLLLTSGEHDGKVALFMAIDEVKFRKVVSPGDQLVMEIEVVRDRERTAQVKGVARVDGDIVIEAMMMFSYADKTFLYGTNA